MIEDFLIIIKIVAKASFSKVKTLANNLEKTIMKTRMREERMGTLLAMKSYIRILQEMRKVKS